jgi:hypothetical protein
VLKGRYVTLDLSGGGTAAGTINAPISKLCAVYYDFSDPAVTANIKVRSLGSDSFSKSGAADTDGVQQISSPPLIAEQTVISAVPSGAGAGDTVKIVLYIDDSY